MKTQIKKFTLLWVMAQLTVLLLVGCAAGEKDPELAPPSVGSESTDPSVEIPVEPTEVTPLNITDAEMLQEELYAAISEVRQPFPMEVSQMVWDQTPEIDIRNLYYELIGQHPELKYAYDITAELESGALTCQISYMPHKTGNYPADWQGISVDTIPELIATAEAHLFVEPLNIRMTDPAMDPDQISYALQQVGGGYILCSLSQDGTQLTYSPAMGMTMDACLALLEQAEELTAETVETLIDDTMTKREQAETLYRYLAEHVKYDQRYYTDRPNMPYDTQTAIGALRDGVAICGGYSHALKLLFSQVDIPCYNVTGVFGSENHMWNIAYLDNQWLWFDATADRGAPHHLELRHFARKTLDERSSWDSVQLNWLLPK